MIPALYSQHQALAQQYVDQVRDRIVATARRFIEQSDRSAALQLTTELTNLGIRLLRIYDGDPSCAAIPMRELYEVSLFPMVKQTALAEINLKIATLQTATIGINDSNNNAMDVDDEASYNPSIIPHQERLMMLECQRNGLNANDNHLAVALFKECVFTRFGLSATASLFHAKMAKKGRSDANKDLNNLISLFEKMCFDYSQLRSKYVINDPNYFATQLFGDGTAHDDETILEEQLPPAPNHLQMTLQHIQANLFANPLFPNGLANANPPLPPPDPFDDTFFE